MKIPILASVEFYKRDKNYCIVTKIFIIAHNIIFTKFEIPSSKSSKKGIKIETCNNRFQELKISILVLIEFHKKQKLLYRDKSIHYSVEYSVSTKFEIPSSKSSKKGIKIETCNNRFQELKIPIFFNRIL